MRVTPGRCVGFVSPEGHVRRLFIARAMGPLSWILARGAEVECEEVRQVIIDDEAERGRMLG